MQCQVCNHSTNLVLSLGYMPPVNDYVSIGSEPKEQVWLPTDLHHCPKCDLVQLGYQADPKVVFPPAYPYTSGSTKILRDNFAELGREATAMLGLTPDDLVVDIGSNDGTLLSNFESRKVGIEPTDTADIAQQQGIKTLKSYFNNGVAKKVLATHGPAKLVTCANCFAHIPGVHEVVENVLELLRPDGVFVTESHYLMTLLERLQYDTIYHEHLRYYSLTSLKHLFDQYGLEIFDAKLIPTHGGSIRVYAARRGQHPVNLRVARIFESQGGALQAKLTSFANDVVASRANLVDRLHALKQQGKRIAAISAPSRASTVVSYCRLDHTVIDYVCELSSSLKVGKYLPGTSIPVVDEAKLFEDQPDYALLFSWHIAEELIPKLRAKGYRGEFLFPCSRRGIYAAAA